VDPQDGRDVLAYAHSAFPSELEPGEQPPAMSESDQAESEIAAEPANSFITGLLTAFGAMATSLGFAVLLGASLVVSFSSLFGSSEDGDRRSMEKFLERLRTLWSKPVFRIGGGLVLVLIIVAAGGDLYLSQRAPAQPLISP
jgi:hypothetical protein